MKLLTLVSLMLTSTYVLAFTAEYPKSPLKQLTPGSLCDRPDKFRYPEQIAYCERDVSGQQKREIFEDYRRAGFRLDPSTRGSFKVDHFIPLCAGGSNHDDNLWPQHRSVYEITDPLEGLGCEKLAVGRISQAELVKRITTAKKDISQAAESLRYLNSL
jgi:hypothetical protein